MSLVHGVHVDKDEKMTPVKACASSVSNQSEDTFPRNKSLTADVECDGLAASGAHGVSSGAGVATRASAVSLLDH